MVSCYVIKDKIYSRRAYQFMGRKYAILTNIIE